MGLLRKNLTPTLECMHGAIDQWTADKDLDRCQAELRRLADDVPTLFKRDRFVGMVTKLLMVGRPDSARKLIDAMGSTGLTMFGFLLSRGIGRLFGVASIVAIVLAVLWMAGVV